MHPPSNLRRHHRRARLRTVPTDHQALGEDVSGLVLGPQRAQLLLVLVLRIHDVDGRGACRGASACVLEAADAAVDEDWRVCADEHDNVECDCDGGQGHVLASFH